MVIIKLMGGLGNQMFQYAAGRRLAHIHNVPLKIDLNWFDNIHTTDTHREYALSIFTIQEDIATSEEVKALTVREQSILEQLFIKSTGRVSKGRPSYVREKHVHFDHEILSLPDNVYLEGYWQSEKYFLDVESLIRHDFTIKTPPERKTIGLAKKIASSNSVSLHIRRGDYVLNPKANKYHGTCELDYYLSCIEKLTQIIKRPHFFIFSDDHDWVRDKLKLSYQMTLVDHNGPDKAYEDLRLIRQCKHHIIANSSFSWWGAWLCTNQEKIVYAPSKWFNSPSLNSEDLIPDSWVRI